jgi:hypothetical protein
MEAQFYELLSFRTSQPFNFATTTTNWRMVAHQENTIICRVNSPLYEMVLLCGKNDDYEKIMIEKHRNKGNWNKKELAFFETHKFTVTQGYSYREIGVN